MIYRGIGYSTDEDSFIAGQKAARRALSENNDPDIAIAFISAEFDIQLCFDGIRSELGDTPVWGTSTALVATNAGVRDNAVSVVLFSSEYIDFQIYSVSCDMDNPKKTAYELGKRYRDDNNIEQQRNIVCFLTGTEKHFKGAQYLDGLKQAFPFPIAISGAGSNTKYNENMAVMFDGTQLCGDHIAQDSLSLLFMDIHDTEQCTASFSYESNWTALASPVICTKTEKHIVYNVDDMSIIEYLKKYLGENYQDTLTKTNYKYTFIAKLKDEHQDKYVVRTPHIDFENNRISFFPAEDMQNIEIQLVQLNRHELIHSAETASLNALASIEGFKPVAVFMFSCHLRARILHSKLNREIDSLRKFFLDDVPIMGFYGAGEYGPVYNSFEDVINCEKNYAVHDNFQHLFLLQC